MNALRPVPPVDPAAPPRSPAGDVGAPAVASFAVQEAANLRLVIEEDQNTGAFVYKTLDRATGEVVRQFPREELLKLQSDPAYEAGLIYKAQV